MRRPLIALAATLLLIQSPAGLAAEVPAGAPVPSPVPVASWIERGSPGPWGIYLNDMDPSVRPGDDFYRYANGAWLARFQLPAGRATWNTMTGLRSEAERQIAILIDRSGDKPDANADSSAVFALNAAFMDTAGIEARGLTPIEPDLARIRAAANLNDIVDLMALGHSSLPAAGLRFFARPRFTGQSGSGIGFGLEPSGAVDIRIFLDAGRADELKRYQVHVQRLLELGGWSDPKGSAKAIVALETDLARDAVRIPAGRTWSLAELEAEAKGFPWRRMFAATGVPGDTATSYLLDPAAFAKVMARTPIKTLRAWQALALLSNAAPYLPAVFADEAESFRAASRGQPIRPRNVQARALVEAELNEALVRLHQKHSLTAGRIAAQEAIGENVRAALRARIAANPWMSQEAKAEADLRLAALKIVLGRPAAWAQPEPPVLSKDDLYGDIQSLQAAKWAAILREMQGGPEVDFTISRLSTNAFYNPVGNEVFVTTPLLSPPFVDPKADPAVNYGGFGMLLASIMVRAVDVVGAEVDHSGALRGWWTPADYAEWERRITPLVAQYSTFEVWPGLFIDGRKTQIENASDLAGVLVALDAYHMSLKGAEAAILDGFSGDQRFFLAQAQVWQFKATETGLRRQLVTDFRAPPPWRVIGTLRNVDAWYDAFGVKPGDKMYVKPEDRVRIW